ncbi:MAG: acyltransferase family protein, partial [Planctomycetota bacterium]|nr:acyltransferase family protein [Planctomycetota bacterium]
MHHKPVLDDRRHDLDALRAVAMLLGIALHVSLSLAPIPWSIQDTRQHPGFLYFFLAIHGFRMQLFFLISGYFTMMLYRKRGSIALLKQRALRIVIPCLIGMATIVPLDNWIVARSIRLASQSTTFGPPPLVRAIRAGDKSQIIRV